MFFWPKVVNWSIYVLNWNPIYAFKDITLDKAWSRWNPLVGHFKVFGCITYVYTPNKKWNKLDDEGENVSSLGLVNKKKPTNFLILLQRR